MGENKKSNEGEHKKEAENKKKDNGGGGKNNVTVVLKADLHCEGCASKVIKCIQNVDGVDTATIGEGQKITVVGKVDPLKLRERVQQKTHKKVELISPLPKKDNNNGDNKENAKGKDDSKPKQETKKEKGKTTKDKSEEKKPKEPPVTTAVLKVHLHCEGCIQKIYKLVSKTKGYQEIKIDKQKDLVTVTGAMDMKALTESLKKHLKRNVEIVPPKKEGEKKENAGGDKKKSVGGDGTSAVVDAGRSEKASEVNKVQSQVVYPYPYPFLYGSGVIGDQIHYNPYVGPYHAPQLFSDENPNACSVM